MDEQQNYFPLNHNLLSIIFSYLNCKDISQFSQVNKSIHNFTEQVCSHFWKEECNSFFCSDYEKNRIVDIEAMTTTSLLSSIRSNQKAEIELCRKKNNPVPLSNDTFNWKLFFNLGITIQSKWDKYIELSDEALKDDLSEMKSSLYSYLKEFSGFPKLRKKNKEVENEINTQFQLNLYDYIGNEEEILEEYNEIFNPGRKDSGDSANNCNMLSVDDYPFASLLEHFPIVLRQIQSNQQSAIEFQELRWYIYTNIDKLDCLNDSIVVFLMKVLIATLKHYCILSYNYLNKQLDITNNAFEAIDTDNDEEFLQNFYMRYKNYTETAIEFNDKYRHINLIVNFIYEKMNTFSFPKFSLLRMFMIIWHNEVTKKLSTSLVNKLSHLFSNVIETDLNGLSFFNKSITSSISSRGSVPTFDVSTYSDFSSVKDTNYRMNLSSTYQMSNNIFLKPFDSPSSKPNNVKKEIISSVISCLNDAFCNEYNIFQINLVEIEADTTYTQIENSFTQILEEKISNYYYMRMKSRNNIQQIIVEEILNYFDKSSFISGKFINKLRFAIYKTVYETIEKLLLSEITNRFINEFISSNIYQNIPLSLVESIDDNMENKYIFSTLLNCLDNIKLEQKIKEYIVLLFLSKYRKQNNNLLPLIEKITIRYSEKEDKDIIKKKQVKKEIKKRNLNYTFDECRQKLLSFSWTPNLNQVKDCVILSSNICN